MEEISIPIPGLTLAAKAWGSSDNPPVLAMHGWLDNAATFDLIAPLLPDIYLVAVDLPGHAKSDSLSDDCVLHYIDYTLYMFQVADALHWKKFSLLGHSLGAIIASTMAGVLPDRIVKLAAIEALGPLSVTLEDTLPRIQKFISDWLGFEKAGSAIYPDQETAASMRTQDGIITFEAANILASRGVVEVDGGVAWRYDKRHILKSPRYFSEEQVLAFLRAIRASTCLIWGKQGYRKQFLNMETRISSIQNLKLHEIEGGHHLHLENPEPVAMVLKHFFTHF